MTFHFRNGAELREKRKLSPVKISLRRLAQRAGISAAYLSDIELGRRKLNPATLARIANAYTDLISETETQR